MRSDWTWDLHGDIHDHDFMVNLHEELRLQMWDIHTMYDCARKVLTRHTDLLSKPNEEIKKALKCIWHEYQYTSTDTPRMAYRACLLYTSPSPRDRQKSRMPSSA